MKTKHDSETPAPGKQVISACAFIHNSFGGVEKLFLAKRADTKKFLPGIFELPGGHIDFGEDLVTGLKREIREEFGVEISVGDPFAAFTYENLIKGSHTVEVVYFAKFKDTLSKIATNPEDHSSFEWLAADDVARRRDEIIPSASIRHEQEEDPEYLAIFKGFELLAGKGMNFG